MLFKKLCAILFIVILFPQISLASRCYEDSPSLKKGVDPRSEINVREPSKEEYRDLEKLMDRMIGNWQGKAVETSCKGSADEPVAETEEYKVDAKVTRKRPHITASLESTWYSAKRKTTRLENLILHLDKEYLRINSYNPDGDIELVKVTDTFLVTLKKENIRNRVGGVTAQEVVRTVAMTDGMMMIEYATYINGGLVAHSVWELNKK